MNAEFYQGNRQRLYDSLPDHTLLLLFSGSSIRKTADENYPFYADRSFLYLTGIGQEHTVLMAEKDGEEVQETLYILPPDMLAERWTGKRFTPEEARARSGTAQIASSGEWENRLKLLMRSGRFERIAMDLYRHDPEDADTESIRMARKLRKWYPAATLTDISRQIRRQRTIKQPCEIEAMREAVKITRDGILAMMKASKPGMYEYQYKAEFDYALAQHGCLAPAFPSIIDVDATIVCERDSHKGIIIGKGGSMLKRIGTAARMEIENLMDTKVNLKLWVKVRREWRDSDMYMKNYGYNPKEI